MNTACIKCKGTNGPPVILIRKDEPPLCRHCFMTHCIHKFRTAFGKNKIVRTGDAVLVSVSGGTSSLGMLNLLKECQKMNTKFQFSLTVVHLFDTNNTCNNEVEEILKASEFPYRILPLSEDEIPLPATTTVSNSTLTAMEDVSRWRRIGQLVDVARDLKCTSLLVGDNASHLATLCLSELALGRGSSLASELAFADSRYGDVWVLRPMYQFMSNEVAMYVKLSGLRPVTQPSLTAREALSRGCAVNSIQRLSGDFVASLQFGAFPSTSRAILSAASKTMSNENGSDKKCSLCRALISNPVKNQGGTATALASLLHSARISQAQDFSTPLASLTDNTDHWLCGTCLVNQNEIYRTHP